MAKREQIKKKVIEKKNTEQYVEEQPVDNEVDTDILKHTDDLLDEIDAVLEPMGVEVALNYRQFGGQ